MVQCVSQFVSFVWYRKRVWSIDGTKCIIIDATASCVTCENQPKTWERKKCHAIIINAVFTPDWWIYLWPPVKCLINKSRSSAKLSACELFNTPNRLMCGLILIQLKILKYNNRNTWAPLSLSPIDTKHWTGAGAHSSSFGCRLTWEIVESCFTEIQN